MIIRAYCCYFFSISILYSSHSEYADDSMIFNTISPSGTVVPGGLNRENVMSALKKTA